MNRVGTMADNGEPARVAESGETWLALKWLLNDPRESILATNHSNRHEWLTRGRVRISAALCATAISAVPFLPASARNSLMLPAATFEGILNSPE